MKKLVYSLIVSAIFSVVPAVSADAQSYPAPGRSYVNREYAGGDHHGKYRHGHFDDDDDDDDDYEEYYKHQKKAYKKYKKAQKKYYKERRKYYRDYDRHCRYHRRLPDMVRRASRGGRDVRVWQVGPDTYVVKYRQGGRWCERYLYPESNRYGNVRFVVNADPMRGWQLIPSLEFNFSL